MLSVVSYKVTTQNLTRKLVLQEKRKMSVLGQRKDLLRLEILQGTLRSVSCRWREKLHTNLGWYTRKGSPCHLSLSITMFRSTAVSQEAENCFNVRTRSGLFVGGGYSYGF